MILQLVSVNVGQPEELAGGKPMRTGIFKRPQAEPVRVGRLGLAGDAICDTENHGGQQQAVYLYGVPDYAWWEAELGRPLEPGTFGENLTIDGFSSAEVRIGDRYRIGPVLLEATCPRIPCRTFAARMGDPRFPKRFMAARRPGVYCRVLVEGELAAGDAVECLPAPPGSRALLDLFRK